MSRSLVIVESPAKAKTIQKYLGEGFVVESSIGHIRDLAVPKNLDKKLRKSNEYINSYAVDVDNNFAPIYLVSDGRKSHIAELRRQLKASDELLLATDEDREGESIAWHLLEVLKPKVPVRRMVFHEITPKAIKSAVESPRELDQHLVDAQEARRILDRLYGFAMTMVVRQRARSRSAGRVQSVATRAVVERERERIAFVRASYWDLDGTFQLGDESPFDASLARIDGKRIASGRDYSDRGQLKNDVFPLDEAAAKALAAKLNGQSFTVGKVERKPYKRSPAAPFMTSTLQQEAGRKLRFSSSRTMRAAQILYENGFITYMRTDSTTLSTAAIDAARNQIRELYDEADLPKAPRVYKRKVKNAQEAHEAIRPAGDVFKTPAEVALSGILPDAKKIYELIWKRTIASQMEDAKGHTITLRLHAEIEGQKSEFSVSGTTITFPGFLKAYEETSDDEGASKERTSRRLPNLQEGQTVIAKAMEPKGHETQPPSRYTEASLVKWLEERGIGRPSTYASIINVIQERGYVWKKGSAMVPTWRAFQVIRMLEDHFGHLIDYDFTARMESDLDAIASGDEERSKWLKRFFFGDDGQEGLEALVERKMAQLNPGQDEGLQEIRRLETFEIGQNKEGQTIQLRMGNYGPYLTLKDVEGKTASVPEDLPPDELTLEKAIELMDAPKDERELGIHPETGETVYLKGGRFGRYVQIGELVKGSKEKPITASLLKNMDPATLTLEDALKVLSLPRTVGKAPDGEEIQATNGRYGPYIVKGKENRSLETEEQIFSVTVEECLKLLAEPKRGRGRRAAKPPLKELGLDPVSEKLIVVKNGNWGLYVTDGETNASLRTGDHLDSITPERAQELLQLRRDKGPSTRKKSTKKAAKKKTTKKVAKKKTTKKAAKKKTTKKAAKKKTTKKAAKTAGV